MIAWTPACFQWYNGAMNERERGIVNRAMRAAKAAFWHWYCHDNNPPPEWWRRTGPYKNWLEALEALGLLS